MCAWPVSVLFLGVCAVVSQDDPRIRRRLDKHIATHLDVHLEVGANVVPGGSEVGGQV